MAWTAASALLAGACGDSGSDPAGDGTSSETGAIDESTGETGDPSETGSETGGESGSTEEGSGSEETGGETGSGMATIEDHAALACGLLSGPAEHVKIPHSGGLEGMAEPWVPVVDAIHDFPVNIVIPQVPVELVFYGWVRVEASVGERVTLLVEGDEPNGQVIPQFETRVRAFGPGGGELPVTKTVDGWGIDLGPCGGAHAVHSLIADGDYVDFELTIGNLPDPFYAAMWKDAYVAVGPTN